MTVPELRASFAEFSAFAGSLKGDEKSEAQLFLDKFFRALGHGGVQEAGATLEFRIAKKPGSAQLELIKGEDSKPRLAGKKFADLLWPGRVLIEMKQRGYPLEKAYDQLFEYWQLIVPNRPAYAILCNFDEFWIYDFNTQLFDPVDRVPLAKLAENLSPFNFLLPTPKKPIFDNNRVEVTRKAADRMAQLFRDIVFRGEDRARTQRFILQLLVAMVAEDIGLLPGDIVTELLGECAERGGSSYDLLGGLFRQMAAEEPARGGRYLDVRYFNGGLFAVVDPIELKQAEAYAVHDAARYNDWSKVKPEIFGTLFQQSMETGKDATSAMPSARILRVSLTSRRSSARPSCVLGGSGSKPPARVWANSAKLCAICAFFECLIRPVAAATFCLSLTAKSSASNAPSSSRCGTPAKIPTASLPASY